MVIRADDLTLAFLHIEKSNDAFPRISLVPKPDKTAEVAEMFEEAALKFAEEPGSRESSRVVYSSPQDKQSVEHPEDEYEEASWYELEDRLSYLQARVPKGGYLETNFTWAKWKRMLEAFEWKCAYCRSSDELGQDHVIPISDGGDDMMENILPSCRTCNQKKAHRTMSEWLVHCPLGTIARIEAGRKKCL